MTPAEIVARMFAAYENGGTMTEGEFVKAVLAKYEVWDDGCEPTPSFEVVLEWIERDRLEARDYIEYRARCNQAEAKAESAEALAHGLVAKLAVTEEKLATSRDDFRHSETDCREWKARAGTAAAELRKYHPCPGSSNPKPRCWYDATGTLRHEETVYHKVETP
jgi:hypothetical protein